MNGPLKTLAASLVELEAEIARADVELNAACLRKNQLAEKRNETHKKLLERVGANIRKRVYVVGNRVVTVEFERGVSVHEAEVE